MLSDKGIRLCIFSTIRTNDISPVPGDKLKEAIDLGTLVGDVTLIHFHKRYSKRNLSENVRVITLPFLDINSPKMLGLSIIGSYFISIPVLLGLKMRYKFNLFRADDPLMTGFPCAVVARLTKTHCLASLYGDIEEVVRYKLDKKRASVLANKIIHSITRFVLHVSDGCIVVNKKLQDHAYSLGCKRIFLTYPNIDLSLFSSCPKIKHERFTALFVGRLEPEKGPLNILSVAESEGDIEFLVVGSGSLNEQMNKMIVEKQLTNVKMIGRVAHEDMASFFGMADVFLLPSFSEGLPIVMLEAMASEIPVIVSNVGGVGDILADDNGGFAVVPGDIKDIVRLMGLLKENEELRKELGKKGRLTIMNQFNNFIEDQVKIYRAVLGVAK